MVSVRVSMSVSVWNGGGSLKCRPGPSDAFAFPMRGDDAVMPFVDREDHRRSDEQHDHDGDDERKNSIHVRAPYCRSS